MLLNVKKNKNKVYFKAFFSPAVTAKSPQKGTQ